MSQALPSLPRSLPPAGRVGIGSGVSLPPPHSSSSAAPGEGSIDDQAPLYQLATLALALITRPGTDLTGILLRARPGPVRDAFTAALANARRLPASAEPESLDPGLDLTATLAAGRPVHRPGLLAEAAAIPGTILIVPMAERLSPALAARLATALDAGCPPLLLLDEGDPGADADADDQVAPALADRLAIHLDLTRLRFPMGDLLAEAATRRPFFPPPGSGGDGGGQRPTTTTHQPAADLTTQPPGDPATLLTTTAAALGIASIRAPLHATRLAHQLAALAGRSHPAPADLEAAAALVLGPRATRLPPGDAPAEAPEPQRSADPPPPAPDGDPADAPPQPGPDSADRVLDAARTTLPPGLLDALAAGAAPRATGSGRAGARIRSRTSGSPAGVRAGTPGRGARLALIETIKAAAPWQKLRPQRSDGRLSIRHDDLRIRRFVARTETTTVFAVDASGSAAFARLAEAKGAVELLLAQAYVKRAEVALVAFRGDGAVVTLPPTRSLARAKRELAGLAGGGGTPIAAGLDLAARIAAGERARGRTPLIVVLTDGRANVGPAGAAPQDAALASARALAAAGLKAVFIDCSARPRAEGAAPALAAAMAARYVALPRLDARTVVAAVNAA